MNAFEQAHMIAIATCASVLVGCAWVASLVLNPEPLWSAAGWAVWCGARSMTSLTQARKGKLRA